jgi:hypothetical protein
VLTLIRLLHEQDQLSCYILFRSTIPVARQPSSASALSTPVVVADGVPRDVDDSGRENVTTCQQLEDPTNIVNVLKPQRNKTWLMLQPFPAFSCKKI